VTRRIKLEQEQAGLFFILRALLKSALGQQNHADLQRALEIVEAKERNLDPRSSKD
jgi:hypothetical protein